MQGSVDVLINVFSKPWQTALALLTLLRHSGQHIDRIYFHEEPAHSSFERRSHEQLLRYLGERVIYFQLPGWLGNESVDAARLGETTYRHSIRYQYGFEHSARDMVLFIHNDIVVTGDIVGHLLAALGEHTGVGQIGQCWWCPAHQNGLCTPERFTSYRPDFATLDAVYRQGFNPTQRRAYHYGWGETFRQQPWPLPECRLNEWCALVNRRLALPHTSPHGTAMPLGAQVASGALIGEHFDQPVNLDTGVRWFRDLVHQGHSFKHVDIYGHIIHEKKGRDALISPELYIHSELAARKQLERDFPDFCKA